VFLTLAQQSDQADLSILARLLDSDKFTILMVFGVGGLITITAILSGVIRSIMIGKAKERTRQEVAAYVAEGSMTAVEGERLLRAGDWDSDDIKREKIMHETIRGG
jgi:hypothetical protein